MLQLLIKMACSRATVSLALPQLPAWGHEARCAVPGLVKDPIRYVSQLCLFHDGQIFVTHPPFMIAYELDIFAIWLTIRIH